MLFSAIARGLGAQHRSLLTSTLLEHFSRTGNSATIILIRLRLPGMVDRASDYIVPLEQVTAPIEAAHTELSTDNSFVMRSDRLLQALLLMTDLMKTKAWPQSPHPFSFTYFVLPHTLD
jgi:hypothetical protein